MNKQDYRQELQKRIRALSDRELGALSSDISETILLSKEWKNAPCLLAYLSFSGDISLDDLIRKSLSAGKDVYVPRIDGRGTMTFRKITDLSPASLELNRWNIREPLSSAEPFVPEQEREVLLLVPGLGFTIEGKRMGRGGGYYDRFLEWIEGKCPFVSMGIAWKGNLLPELPAEPHDRPVSRICCEREILKCQPLN
ncbi:MAG: 5-formyltetrahydrofolate cyclo-ligase [Spirochaetales bacterium]|nr:5-formyltetrahydrofolate cyclo-ligase [Spirochaetales bacterium]